MNAPAGFVEQFVELYGVAYRASYAIVGERAVAEDVAQEATARALARWSRVEDHAPAWVARVATNLALDHVRARSRARSAEARPDPAPEEVAQRRRDLVEALRALPKRQREIVVLRYLVDLSEAQVAASLGCAPGTVKSAAARGLARLRLLLAPPEEEPCSTP